MNNGCKRTDIKKSEIVNQKKQFIFDVEQSSNYVFPFESFTYYIYIKNISTTEINNFVIKIENDKEIYFDEEIKNSIPITLKPGEIKLYEMKASCSEKGSYRVHFICYGDETPILFKTLKIKCNTTYNSDKLIHKISIYDFTPYEETYSMEADNYSEDVTQTFKRQKLPYMAKEQPFNLQKQFVLENIESESLIDQLSIKNTNEHVYQYISRESFIKDSVETFEGENLQDIIDDINNNSKYFNAKFLRTGTNSLLNDFTQYKPNGLIYRLGLLTSELYHMLGIIPTYTYMTDKLFKWAPHKSGYKLFMDYNPDGQLIDLYPRERGMKWGQNVWAGTGWIVRKIVTDEYKKTEEYKKEKEDNLIIDNEILCDFEDKESAISFIKREEELDSEIRYQQQSDIVKFKYTIEESLYENGVFFVNIPINKIPSNFYLPETEVIYNVIERGKPYGVKPIINYVIEKTFKQEIEQSLFLNYHKYFEFKSEEPIILYRLLYNNFIEKEIECDGTSVTVIENTPTYAELYENYAFSLTQKMLFEIPLITYAFVFTNLMAKKVHFYENSLKENEDIRIMENFKEILYFGNYENLSFYMMSELYKQDSLQEKTAYNPNKTDFVLPIDNRYEFDKGENEIGLEVEDIYGKKYRFSVKRDVKRNLDTVKYTYINTLNENIIKKEGLQNIDAISIHIIDVENKKILLMMGRDLERNLHYFNHIIIKDVSFINLFSNTSELPSRIFSGKQTGFSKIILETPFFYSKEEFDYHSIKNENNWENIYRLDKKDSSYAFIKNLSKNELTPQDIILHYENFNLPKTSIIKELKLKLNGVNPKNKNIYISSLLQTNHFTENSKKNSMQLRPKNIECYSQSKESTKYYQIKLQQAEKRNQQNYIDYYNNLIEENILFDEDKFVEIEDYVNNPDDYVKIYKEHWVEVSDFTNNFGSLNETNNIKFVLEGYNEGNNTDVIIQSASETSYSSEIRKNIPAGYFYEEISIPYPNKFLLEYLRVRFRFDKVSKHIKIFNTNLNVSFLNHDIKNLDMDFVEDIYLNGSEEVVLLQDYIYPEDLNNGLDIKLSFDSLNPGESYKLNYVFLECVYDNTETNLLISNNRYRYYPNKGNETTVSGEKIDAYMSGEFYNDIASISQIKSNIGPDNQGTALKEALFQSFETRDDNITGIEIYPNGFVGNPDEIIKIGIYENVNNSPGDLIKEVYAHGWTKTNEETKSLSAIKYNINVSNLKTNETYWFKIEVDNPQENSYYLLKDINQELDRHKLLLRENNNYINTFSTLEFIIYSKNLSKSFSYFPAVQEVFNNPFIFVGLHKNKGNIKNIKINQYENVYYGDDSIKENIEVNQKFFIEIYEDDKKIYPKTNDEEE